MVNDDLALSKDKQSRTRRTSNHLQGEQQAKIPYSNEDNYLSDYKVSLQHIPLQQLSPSSPVLKRPYVIESNGISFNQPADFRQQPTHILTRVFHYIVAPPIIKEAQRMQFEEERDNAHEFQIDYTKASIEFARRIFTEFIGSIIAALLLKLLFRESDVSFILNSPEIPLVDAFIWEVFLTCCMMFVILQTSTKGQIVGPQAAFGLSSIFIFISLIGAKKSSVSMNPFRSIGPALMIKSEKNRDLWLFVAAPVVGMAIALVICGLLQGFKPKSTSELKAAQGNEKKISTK